MADMVDKSGLILTDWMDAQVKAQTAAYQQVQRAREAETYQKAQALEAATNAARQQYAGGNYDAARKTAAAGNAWDVWQGIDTAQKAQVAAQASDIGTAAFNLTKLPKGQARVDYFNSFVPTLKSHGMSDAEIQQYAHSGFLDNDDALSGYRDKAIGIKELYDTEQATIKGQQEHGYKMEELGAGLFAAPDGSTLRVGTGEVVRNPGIKPELVEYKDEQGNTHLVPFGGTASGPAGAADPGATWQRMIGQESGGKQFAANGKPLTSSAGAIGIAQVMPTTGPEAAKLAGLPWDENRYRNDATYNRTIGQAYYQKQLADFGGDAEKAAAAYNAGGGRVRQAVAKGGADWRSHLPAETQDYIAKVAGRGPTQNAAPRGAQDINLGGGRTGPLWVDETRNIGGQNVSGQRNQQTGEFKPLASANKTKPVDLETDIGSLNETIKLTERLYHHPGLSAVVGVPGLTGGLLGGKVIPGTDAAGFQSLMKNFDAKAYLAQVTKMKGLGALSDAEGARLSAAIGSLSTSQSEAEFKRNLAYVRKDLETGRDRLIAKRNSAGGSTSQQPVTRSVGGRTYVKVPGGWRAQ